MFSRIGNKITIAILGSTGIFGKAVANRQASPTLNEETTQASEILFMLQPLVMKYAIEEFAKQVLDSDNS